jgi:hypothetical protein
VGGNYAFVITVTGFGRCAVSRSYNLLVIGNCPPITVNPASLPGGTVGTAYHQAVTAAPLGTYTYSVTNGALPGGLTLNANTGVLSGTPTAGGTFSFTLKATNASGCTGSRGYVVSVACATLTFSPAALPDGTKSVAYHQTLSVSPAGNYTFSLLLGSLPPGFTLNSAAVISGITTQTGTYNFTVKVLGGTCQTTKAYRIVIANALAASRLAGAQSGDYDGDGQSDLTLWSPSDGTWRIVKSSNQQAVNQSWGVAGDVTLLGDYDGDSKSDLTVFRPSDATWYVKRSSDESALVKQWGLATDVPVPGDYDGDGKTDIAVWRGANGTWYVVRSSDGMIETTTWGASAAPYHDVAVPGDYDGDGQTDVAVFRRSNGTWLVKRSRDGQYVSKLWGLGTDVPVAADYDGDGQTDIAVWRGGIWYIWQSATDSYRVAEWGTNQAPYYDQVVPGDYDGDGQTDLAVWRPSTASWHFSLSGAARGQAARVVSLGQASDQPVGARR